jgi:hypothetical protein
MNFPKSEGATKHHSAQIGEPRLPVRTSATAGDRERRTAATSIEYKMLGRRGADGHMLSGHVGDDAVLLGRELLPTSSVVPA